MQEVAQIACKLSLFPPFTEMIINFNLCSKALNFACIVVVIRCAVNRRSNSTHDSRLLVSFAGCRRTHKQVAAISAINKWELRGMMNLGEFYFPLSIF
jgi:hypothetical protein